jgi:hypothetical protein
MRTVQYLDRPHRFPLCAHCADCVPFELVFSEWSAAVEGENSISVSGHHYIKEGTVYCTWNHRWGGGLDNLLMSMIVLHTMWVKPVL